MENQEQLIDNTTVDVKGETIVFPAEWCFRFDDGEPQVFAAANEKIDGQEPAIKLLLSNTEEAKVTFTQDGKSFTIFGTWFVGEVILTMLETYSLFKSKILL